MAKKPRMLDAEEEDVNIIPLLNIIMLLIPFLIMSTEFIKLGVINVTAPKLGSGPSTQQEVKQKKDRPPLNLTISITDKGFTLITRGDKIPEGCNLQALKTGGEKKLPTIKVLGTKHNYPALTKCLVTIKNLFADERRVIIMAEPEIKYEVIIDVMDASRRTPESKELFPEVILSAGLI